MARRDLTGAVNFAYLETYAGHDAALIEEVLGLFHEQAALWARLLDPRQAMDGWRDAAHTLKGAARGIGAEGLAQACEAAELAGRAGESGPQRMDALDALDRVLSDIAAYRHEMAIQSLRSAAPR